MNTPTTQHAAVTTPLSAEALSQLGLEVDDHGDVQELAQKLSDLSPSTIHAFGKEASKNTTEFSEELLERVRNDDLAESGAKLTKVVSIARNLNLTKLSARSRVPVVGPLIDRFRMSKSDLVQRFTNTREQIDQLMLDVDTQTNEMVARVKDLDTMWDIVSEEKRKLGLHAAAGQVRLAEIETERLQLAGRTDPEIQARLAELDNATRLLDKRVSDLKVLQHAAYQALPTIRIIQANNMMLVEKFHSIREITIPTWKRGFMLQLSLNEQRNAVDLVNAVDDATNDMLRANAKLLHQNAVETAKANQRLAIDVETLQFVHNELIETIEDVRSTHAEGMRKRKDAESKLMALREDVQQRLAAPTAPPAIH